MARAVVVGAGHNGLVCAAYLAGAGLDVTVCEQAARPGGCVVTEEPVPGFRVDVGALELGGIVTVVRDLGLEGEGLRLVPHSHVAVSISRRPFYRFTPP